MHRYALLSLAMALTLFVGCKSLSRPSWFQPGPATVQRARAQQFDPYPETKTGPEIVGARPRDYQEPVPETARARSFPWKWGK